MKRIKVQIERQTQKAYLVIDEKGRKGWIQRRWLDDDGNVAEKTMSRASDNFKERENAYAEAKEWSENYHKIIEVERETGKAVAVKALFDAYNIERDYERLLWIPKSLINNMAIPGWFVAKKIREAAEQLSEQIRTGVLLISVAIEDCDNFHCVN